MILFYVSLDNIGNVHGSVRVLQNHKIKNHEGNSHVCGPSLICIHTIFHRFYDQNYNIAVRA